MDIDISKVKNLDTLSDNSSVKDFINSQQKNINKKEESQSYYKLEEFEKYPRKFEFVHAERVQLPSNGLPYQDSEDDDIRNGYIWIYPLTMKELEILSTNRYIYDGTATIKVLNNCIKSNISAMDLITTDFYFLLLYLRQASISDEFSFNVICDKCGKNFEHTIKISELNYLYEDFKEEHYKEPIRIDVEDFTILTGLPRIKNIRELNWMIRNNEEIGPADFMYSRTLAIISPTGEEVPKKLWVEFYNNLPSSYTEDIINKMSFYNAIDKITEGIRCPECGEILEGSEININQDNLFRGIEKSRREFKLNKE